MTPNPNFLKVLERMKKECEEIECGIDYFRANLPEDLSCVQIKLKQCKLDVQYIRQVLSELEEAIGIACWKCKHRTSDYWNVEENFCKFYPTLLERKMLVGLRCGYFEGVDSDG